jgi:hypothetical protein
MTSWRGYQERERVSERRREGISSRSRIVISSPGSLRIQMRLPYQQSQSSRDFVGRQGDRQVVSDAGLCYDGPLHE